MQKILRDVAFFGVVIYAAVMTFLVFDAKAQEVQAENDLISAKLQTQQVAFHR